MAGTKVLSMAVNLRNRVPDCNVTEDHMGNYETEKYDHEIKWQYCKIQQLSNVMYDFIHVWVDWK